MNKVVKIDGVGLNTEAFGNLSKEDAIDKMERDGILETHNRDKVWAGTAFDKMKQEMKIAADKQASEDKKTADKKAAVDKKKQAQAEAEKKAEARMAVKPKTTAPANAGNQ